MELNIKRDLKLNVNPNIGQFQCYGLKNVMCDYKGRQTTHTVNIKMTINT